MAQPGTTAENARSRVRPHALVRDRAIDVAAIDLVARRSRFDEEEPG